MTPLIRALLAEDDEDFSRLLRLVLSGCGEAEVVGTASTGCECLSLLDDLEPDLLLVDVVLPDLSGLEVAEAALCRPSPPIVAFVTAYSDYAARAFDLHAADYILKPADPAELQPRVLDMLARVRDELVHRQLAAAGLTERLVGALEQLSGLSARHPQSIRGRLAVRDPEEGTVRVLSTERISHIVRGGRRVLIAAGGRQFATYCSIDRLEQRLAGDGFVRVDSGALVNVAYVEHLVPNGDGSYDVILTGSDTVVHASRSRSRQLLDALSVR